MINLLKLLIIDLKKMTNKLYQIFQQKGYFIQKNVFSNEFIDNLINEINKLTNVNFYYDSHKKVYFPIIILWMIYKQKQRYNYRNVSSNLLSSFLFSLRVGETHGCSIEVRGDTFAFWALVCCFVLVLVRS